MTARRRSSRAVLLLRLYHSLYDHFGPLHWWPGDSPFEIAVGAVLTQNTAWTNVEKAIARLQVAGWLAPEAILAADPAALAEVIRPAGYYRVKARRLHHLCTWWQQHAARAADPQQPLPELRASLLAVHGVGPETADSILLYSFNRLTFVIDAYTRRILSRHGLCAADAPYAELQAWFAANLPAEVPLYNEYHAQLVYCGKDFCRQQPRCAECPLAWHRRR